MTASIREDFLLGLRAFGEKSRSSAGENYGGWHPDEDQLLRRGWALGFSIDELAKGLRRPPEAASARLRQLQREGSPRRHRMLWTEPEMDRLRELRENKVSASEIAYVLGRTHQAVVNRHSSA